MADNKEYRLAIKIAGEVEKSLSEATGKTKKELREIAKEAALSQVKIDHSFSGAMQTLNGPIDSIWDGAMSAVKATAAAVTAAAGASAAAGAIVINVGSDFESAFAGVKKTVDGTDEQLSKLESDIREMAKNKPQTAVELSEIAESAGQLGIQTDNIAAFTNTIADLKEATNLGDEGASQMAQFANITGMAQDKFDRLGSTIVDLGNHMATDEQSIVSMGMRLAGAGTQIGMTQADIMGFSAALSSVGVAAEMGGSALSKTMINMQLAVEKGAEPWANLQEVADQAGWTLENTINAATVGGSSLSALAQRVGMTTSELKQMKKEADESQAELESYAEVAGMASDEFAALFKSNPAEALSAFITGIGDVERNGKSAIMVLDDMGIKEVQQRDALLRAASASDLFRDSLSMANEAFEENAALTNEAAQRYATFESRLGMVKNRFTDVGISLYQSFRDPLNDALGVALDFSDGLELLDDQTISDLAASAKKAIPTMVREMKDGAEAVRDFAEPIITLGEWAVGNPDWVLGGLAAAGTAVGLLKTAQGINAVVTTLKAAKVAAMANPVTAAVAGIALAGGAIAGVAAKVKVANEQMKKANLAEHFGDIALSVDELRDAAKQIVGEKDLEQLSAAMEELGKIKDISSDLESASETIDRMTWKVGMGLELTETDNEDFKNAIDTMVENSIEMVEQAQYTARLNVTALFGTDSDVGQELIDGFDAMYSSINTQVSELGRQLGDAYNSAMEDGIVSTDEAKVIQELQLQMAEITSKVSQAQSEAKLERIRVQFSGKDLDVETFQNFQSQIQETLDEMSANSNQSFDYILGNLNYRLEGSKSGEIDESDVDYLTQEEYDKFKAALDEQLAKDDMEIQLKGIKFSTESIEDAYSEEIGAVSNNISSGLHEAMQTAINTMSYGGNGLLAWDPEQIRRMLNLDEMDRSTKNAINELWENMEPDYLELQQTVLRYQEAGKEIPEGVIEGLRDASAIGAIAGSADAIWQAMAIEAMDNPSFAQALRDAQEAGYTLPDTVAAAIRERSASTAQAVSESYQQTAAAVQSTYGAGFDVSPEVRTTFRQESANPPIEGMYAYSNEYMDQVFGGGIETESETNLQLDNTDVQEPIDGVYDYAENYAQKKFSAGIDVNAPVRLNVTTETRTSSSGKSSSGSKSKTSSSSKASSKDIDGHADGGIFTEPHVAWFAEGGYPEAAIPIDGSQNAIDLWQKTGELLGVFGAVDTSGSKVSGHADGGLIGLAPSLLPPELSGPAWPTEPAYRPTPTIIYGDQYGYDDYDPYDDYDDELEWEEYDGPGNDYGEFGRYGEEEDGSDFYPEEIPSGINNYDDMAFIAATIAAMVQAQQPPTVTEGGIIVTAQDPALTQSSSQSSTQAYEVQSGDTLEKIAAKHNTTAAAIYEANRDVIEETAKQHGKSSSNSGWWIWPGEVLQIPGTEPAASQSQSGAESSLSQAQPGTESALLQIPTGMESVVTQTVPQAAPSSEISSVDTASTQRNPVFSLLGSEGAGTSIQPIIGQAVTASITALQAGAALSAALGNEQPPLLPFMDNNPVTVQSTVDAAADQQESAATSQTEPSIGFFASPGQSAQAGAGSAPQVDLKSIMDALMRAVSTPTQQAAGPGASSGMIVNYSPVYQISGGDAETIWEADRRSQEEFAKLMQDLQKDQARVSFAG